MLADLGAGDGGTLWPLDRAGLVGETIYAVDISAEHVALCERLSPKVHGIVSDVAHVDELADASVDALISSQVIEHLPDDRVLAPEIARLLKPGGWFYLASVIRGPHAFWLYKGKPPAPERWQLDPTHMREYESEEHFRSVLEHPELELDVVRSSQLKFPLTDPLFRIAAASAQAGAAAGDLSTPAAPPARRAARTRCADPRVPLGRGDGPQARHLSE